jgi:hypothetical protein
MININRYSCSVLICEMQLRKYFVFLKLIITKNKNSDKVNGKLFMIKSGPGFMGSLMHSLIKDIADIGSYN